MVLGLVEFRLFKSQKMENPDSQQTKLKSNLHNSLSRQGASPLRKSTQQLSEPRSKHPLKQQSSIQTPESKVDQPGFGFVLCPTLG